MYFFKYIYYTILQVLNIKGFCLIPFQANAVKSEKSIAATTTSSEKAAVPAIHIENLKADLKAGVDDLKHPADIDHDALKLVMDFR